MRRFNLKDSHGNLHLIEADHIDFDDNGTLTFENDGRDGFIAAFAPGAWSAVFSIILEPVPIEEEESPIG